MIIDTHSHLYAEEFDADRNEVLARAHQTGIAAILLPNIDVQSIGALEQLADEHSACIPMMGLHPTYVKENWQQELAAIEAQLFAAPKRYCAVGEIGLDLYWDDSFLEPQKEVFRLQVQWAKKLQLPIAIHVRKAFEPIFEILDQEWTPELRGVFHCFTGSKEQVQRILKYEHFYFGIGGVITYKNAGLAEVVKEIPLDKLLLETDAPYLSPIPYRGKRNEPAYLIEVVSKLQEALGLSAAEIEAHTSRNAIDLFDLEKFLTFEHA
ncbi:MAG: TatD family hydrolase [Sphingomonadales bacterium]